MSKIICNYNSKLKLNLKMVKKGHVILLNELGLTGFYFFNEEKLQNM